MVSKAILNWYMGFFMVFILLCLIFVYLRSCQCIVKMLYIMWYRGSRVEGVQSSSLEKKSMFHLASGHESMPVLKRTFNVRKESLLWMPHSQIHTNTTLQKKRKARLLHTEPPPKQKRGTPFYHDSLSKLLSLHILSTSHQISCTV